ncbi:MAG: hypothetical protein JSV63_03245 [Candidatus Aenigmatarchaeota archaeon]|nr:MAG: hypothetical protein JSV63_03245 [Candidatus Aenigmarchaeota archaeon]
MLEKGYAIGLVFLIFGAALLAQVIGVIIDCANITCTPLSGVVTILLTVIAVLSIIFGLDRTTKY